MNRSEIDGTSTSKRKGPASVALTILAALCAALGGGALWWTSAQQEKSYRAEANEAAKQQVLEARKLKISECSKPGIEAEACSAKIENESRKAQQEIFDLEAQRTMAVWTRAMGVATVAGMAIAILSLGFIFLTLRATQRATAFSGIAARQAMRSLFQLKEATAKQLRPYVAISEKDEGLGQPFNRQSKMTFIVRNFGQIPASNVRLSVGDAFVKEPIGDVEIALGEKYGDYGLIAPNDFRTERIRAEDIRLDELAEMISQDRKLVVRIRIDYEWPGGTDFHDMTVLLDDPSVSRWRIVDDRRRRLGAAA